MWTIRYRNVYIFGYCDKDEVWFYRGGDRVLCKSLHAAYCRIARSAA